MLDFLDNLPPTDLKRLHREVLSLPAEAALPCNLSDEWLDLISRDLQRSLTTGQTDRASYMHAPLAIILHIANGKAEGGGLEVSYDNLCAYIQDFQIELAIEEVSRKTHFKAEPASLATIFTNRSVNVEAIVPSSIEPEL